MSNLISKTDELSEFSITQLTWSLTADVDNEFYAGPRGPVPLSMSITSTENTRPSSTTPAMSCYNSLCCFELSSHSHRAVTVTPTYNKCAFDHWQNGICWSLMQHKRPLHKFARFPGVSSCNLAPAAAPPPVLVVGDGASPPRRRLGALLSPAPPPLSLQIYHSDQTK